MSTLTPELRTLIKQRIDQHVRENALRGHCRECGVEIPEGRINVDLRKFCSRTCANRAAYHNGLNRVACESCGNPLPPKRARFCSKACRNTVVNVPRYGSPEERLEARRETWRVAGRKKHAKKRAARLAERTEKCA
jgi:predicted nucleic acid-binding Zn ribbon protein